MDEPTWAPIGTTDAKKGEEGEKGEEGREMERKEKWGRQRKEGGREERAPTMAPVNTQFFPLAACRHNLYHDINPGWPQDICERQVPAALLKCPSHKQQVAMLPATRLAPAAGGD